MSRFEELCNAVGTALAIVFGATFTAYCLAFIAFYSIAQ